MWNMHTGAVASNIVGQSNSLPKGAYCTTGIRYKSCHLEFLDVSTATVMPLGCEINLNGSCSAGTWDEAQTSYLKLPVLIAPPFVVVCLFRVAL